MAASNDQKEALVKQPVKHVLSQELQLYFDRVARMLRGGDEEGRELCSPASGPCHKVVRHLPKQSIIRWEASTLLEMGVVHSLFCGADAHPQYPCWPRQHWGVHFYLSCFPVPLHCTLHAPVAEAGVCTPGKTLQLWLRPLLRPRCVPPCWESRCMAACVPATGKPQGRVL